MSIKVCLLARWEADDYVKKRGITFTKVQSGRSGLPRVHKQHKHIKPDCRRHKHIKLEEAQEMVSGSAGWSRPVAEWVRCDECDKDSERRIAALEELANVRDLSARIGFDRQGRTVKSGGKTGLGETGEEAQAREIPNESRRKLDVVFINANNRKVDWIGPFVRGQSHQPWRPENSRAESKGEGVST